MCKKIEAILSSEIQIKFIPVSVERQVSDTLKNNYVSIFVNFNL